MGSDGLWDNILESELLEVVGRVVVDPRRGADDSSEEDIDSILGSVGLTARTASRRRALAVDPHAIAEAIATTAQSRSRVVAGRALVADECTRCGGRVDDITVVAAWILPAAEGSSF
mmetsp:Transcript_64380/g.185033  ORF Transcript_64380/g.185033 Transcript_64380/m.185033 type:complete len:117 (+) Transcript_64380:2-352(+)